MRLEPATNASSPLSWTVGRAHDTAILRRSRGRTGAAWVDYDPAQAVSTRLALFEKLADGGALVIGAHFHAPTAGRIVRTPDGYRFDTGDLCSRSRPDIPGSP